MFNAKMLHIKIHTEKDSLGMRCLHSTHQSNKSPISVPGDNCAAVKKQANFTFQELNNQVCHVLSDCDEEWRHKGNRIS